MLPSPKGQGQGLGVDLRPLKDKYLDRSSDSSQHGGIDIDNDRDNENDNDNDNGNESNEDDDNDGYRSIDKYNSMRVGRTESVTSDMMINTNTKNSFSSVYESTRSESPPSGYKSQKNNQIQTQNINQNTNQNINQNMKGNQSQSYNYNSLSNNKNVSGGKSSAWRGPVYNTDTNTDYEDYHTNNDNNPLNQNLNQNLNKEKGYNTLMPEKSQMPQMTVTEVTPERNLFIKMPKIGTPNVPSPSRGLNARSPDLMTPDESIPFRGTSLIIPFYRSNASRSRSRSAGKWRVDSSSNINNIDNIDNSNKNYSVCGGRSNDKNDVKRDDKNRIDQDIIDDITISSMNVDINLNNINNNLDRLNDGYNDKNGYNEDGENINEDDGETEDVLAGGYDTT